MLVSTFLTCAILLTTGVTITEPLDGGIYDGDWLTIRAIVENENELPDSVHYALNEGPVNQIPRLNTDWYTYMGNDSHTGYSESPAPLNANILWSKDIQSHLSPIVADGMVFCQGDNSSDSLHVLNALTGDLIWKFHAGESLEAISTVKDGLVYVPGDSLWCLDSATGERIWANGDVDMSGNTPAVFEGKVYSARSLTWGDVVTYLYCFDACTGACLWNDTLPGRLYNAITVKDNIAFVPISFGPVQDATLYAIDASSGSIIWQNCYSQGYNASSAVFVEENIYISWPSGIVRALHSLTGNLLWESQISTAGGMMHTPAYHDSRLFVGSGGYELFCLDALTGQDCWSTTGYCVSSPAIADNVLFFCEYYNLGDTVSVFALDSQSGSEIWTFQTDSKFSTSTPAITDGILYISTGAGKLHAFGTGLKYTYLDDCYAQVGLNELIVTSFYGGAVTADTISFTVTQTGIDLNPSRILDLAAIPNPFVSNASISFELSEAGYTSVDIYDLSGRQVASLVDSEVLQGKHTVQWNGYNKSGEEVSSGLYLCRIESAGDIENIGLCLLR